MSIAFLNFLQKRVIANIPALNYIAAQLQWAVEVIIAGYTNEKLDVYSGVLYLRKLDGI